MVARVVSIRLLASQLAQEILRGGDLVAGAVRRNAPDGLREGDGVGRRRQQSAGLCDPAVGRMLRRCDQVETEQVTEPQPPRRADALDMQDRVLQAIKEKLTDNGIDLPFPTQQVLFHDQTEESDGDRRRQREGWPTGQGDAPKPRRMADAITALAESGALSGRAKGNGHDGARG